jgi:gas vesicle protein
MATRTAATDVTSDACAQGDRNFGFVMGLLAGGAIGVGVGMLFAPQKALELRKRAADSGRRLGSAAVDQYHEAGARIGQAVDEITRKGQGLRDDVADAVVRGAQEVEQYATSAKTGH